MQYNFKSIIMKKISLVILLTIFSITTMNAQGETSFGVTAGFINGSANASVAGFNLDDALESIGVETLDGSGFYVGLLADIGISEKFSVQPEAVYAGLNGESVIIVPVMAKYYIADKFNLQAGPQLDFLFGLNELEKRAIKTTGFSLGFGAGYDINDDFSVQAKYTVGLNNRIDSDLTSFIDDIDIPIIGNLLDPELKVNTLQIGVVYNFN